MCVRERFLGPAMAPQDLGDGPDLFPLVWSASLRSGAGVNAGVNVSCVFLGAPGLSGSSFVSGVCLEPFQKKLIYAHKHPSMSSNLFRSPTDLATRYKRPLHRVHHAPAGVGGAGESPTPFCSATEASGAPDRCTAIGTTMARPWERVECERYRADALST